MKLSIVDLLNIIGIIIVACIIIFAAYTLLIGKPFYKASSYSDKYIETDGESGTIESDRPVSEIEVGNISGRIEIESSVRTNVELLYRKRGEDGIFRWRINLDGITGNYKNIWAGIDGGRAYNGRVLFLSGESSDFICEKDHELISGLFPSYHLETVPGSGHWVHTENPESFRQSVLEFLLSGKE